MTLPYIFLLVDCFEWALIDCIEKQRVHSTSLDISEHRQCTHIATVWYWGGQSAELPGRAENLRNVNCSCRGSVASGGVNQQSYLVELKISEM